MGVESLCEEWCRYETASRLRLMFPVPIAFLPSSLSNRIYRQETREWSTREASIPFLHVVENSCSYFVQWQWRTSHILLSPVRFSRKIFFLETKDAGTSALDDLLDRWSSDLSASSPSSSVRERERLRITKGKSWESGVVDRSQGLRLIRNLLAGKKVMNESQFRSWRLPRSSPPPPRPPPSLLESEWVSE